VYGKVGLMPDWGALWTLPQRIGLARTRRMAMFAEVVAGAEALAIGLVDFLADDGAVLELALRRAQQLADAAPGAISATKACLARAPQSFDALLDWEADTQALLIGSADFAEGSAAFMQKRVAVFKGI
jgi:2-(1,2-epoxy-1,2-dihydrophenyl)acetyl-CoA isomerase